MDKIASARPGDRVRFRMGYTLLLGPHRIAELMDRLRVTNPNMDCLASEMYTPERISGLLGGKLDLGVVRAPNASGPEFSYRC